MAAIFEYRLLIMQNAFQTINVTKIYIKKTLVAMYGTGIMSQVQSLIDIDIWY